MFAEADLAHSHAYDEHALRARAPCADVVGRITRVSREVNALSVLGHVLAAERAIKAHLGDVSDHVWEGIREGVWERVREVGREGPTCNNTHLDHTRGT